jgi:hypothetical protein
MTISASGFEIPETISHTVYLSHEGPGEFSAVYWDASKEAFITVKNVDPGETQIDGSTYEKMLFSLKRRNTETIENKPRPFGLSENALNRIKSSLTDEQYAVICHFAQSKTRDAKSRFVAGCIEQLRAWACDLTGYPVPLTATQWAILNRIYYFKENVREYRNE